MEWNGNETKGERKRKGIETKQRAGHDNFKVLYECVFLSIFLVFVKMGSVDGSQEERIGTGMNADIKSKNYYQLTNQTKDADQRGQV